MQINRANETSPTSLVRSYLVLAKARLSALVLVTTAVGFVLAGGGALDWIRLAWTLVGTALAAFGANALNQYIEADRDGRMHRTQARPLPSGRLTQRQALTFALTTATAGPLILAVWVNPLTATLAVITQLIYVFAYTPLKTRSTLNTLVGAVCGALPPMMGWTAATGRVELGAWVLGAILFLWQIPHFLALAWMYREDYARGGFRMLPLLDPSGRLTGRVIILYMLALLPLGLMVTTTGITGPAYAVGSLILGAGLLALGITLYRYRTAANARRVFLASVIYLPLLLGLMVVDRQAGRSPSHAAAVDIRPHGVRTPSMAFRAPTSATLRLRSGQAGGRRYGHGTTLAAQTSWLNPGGPRP